MLSTKLGIKATDSKTAKDNVSFNENDVTDFLAEENVMIHTQMKSGTTFFCHVLGFYCAKRQGDENASFESLAKNGVFRRIGNGRQLLRDGFLFKQKFPEQPMFLHSHEPHIAGYDVARYKKVVLLTRNPFDYCVSSYHFHFRNRAHTAELQFEDVVAKILRNYINCHHAQQKISRLSKNHSIVSYEDLMEKTYEIFEKIFIDFFDDININWLEESIEKASPENVTKHEEQRGEAIIAGKGFTAKNFIRSGKISEYKEFFTKDQIKQINEILEGYKYKPLQ
ncbi:sulfotransferase domain-containing protein [Pseudovibrio ascidiaceicola]|uniref:sulfotransferase domain-containing protein n=1 Tax=Pseudovibrio ascidiaceicola TaxID=285279 RepID=UPI000D68F409|nr:sulfotransferase domain-containing protein [Pseudovibrio ascidiaceicola]